MSGQSRRNEDEGIKEYQRFVRLGYGYDIAGRPSTFTSYSDAMGTTAVNQVERRYNGLGQFVTEYQEHAGAVNTSTSAKVQYNYSEVASGTNTANDSHLLSMTYPNGRVLNNSYGSG